MQKEKPTRLHIAACISEKCEKILDRMILTILIITAVLAVWCAWDIYSIYNGAGNKELLTFKPGVESDNGYGFDELCSRNPEVIGWITVDDTDIDYPVCQASDNTKYVNTDVMGEFSLTGCPFLDFRNASDFSDDYNLVYGHHVTGGQMFGGLDAFKSDSYFEEHKTGTLYVRDGSGYPIRWFALVETDAYDSRIFTHRPLEDEGSNAGNTQEEFLTYIKEISVQYRTPDGMDVIALSTCCDAETNERILLLGIIERGEKECWKTNGYAEEPRY